MASALVLWLLGLLASSWAWRQRKKFSRRSLFLKAWLCLCVAVSATVSLVVNLPHTSVRAASSSPAHGPIGVGRGVHPGRVVWVHAPDATSWEGESSSEHWWQSNHTDLAVVEPMFAHAIRNLAGQSTDAAAWDALFTHFNQSRGKGQRGYQAQEKIAVKINLTTCNARSGSSTIDMATYEKRPSIMNTIDNSPQMLLCLLRHLVYTVGVRPGDISIGDPTGMFPQFMWDMLHPEFPDVHLFDNYGGAGRTRTEFSTVKFFWSSPEPGQHTVQDYIPAPFAEADYLIDFAVLKGHAVGVTLCGKNFYGALLRCPDGYFRDAKGKNRGGTLDYLNMHDSAPSFGPQGMGQYRAIVDLLAHHELGGKTMLFLIDGLFAGYYWDSHPHPWKTPPFGDGTNGHWPSSLFASQDPVAIDSVAYDFLLNEWPAIVTGGIGAPNSLNGSAEDYLHEAALANNPPSGTRYDPDHMGLGLASLGVHEHWDNAIDKRYSRNRGLNEGIELVAVHVQREPPRLTVRQSNGQISLSWTSAQVGWQLQTAKSLAPPVQWVPVVQPPVLYQAQNVASIPLTNANQFYQLAK
jgi:hypothetical protein